MLQKNWKKNYFRKFKLAVLILAGTKTNLHICCFDSGGGLISKVHVGRFDTAE